MDTPGLGPISPRESEVLAALAEHRTNAQIAHRLRISVRTVESHVSSLLRKLGAADRQALAVLAGPRPHEPAPGVVVGVPHGRTTFVGRHSDHDAVVAALAEASLVSLLGPGGMGKTRLAAVVACAVAAAFPAGAAFVDLVPVRSGQVALAVAAVLGVTERPPQPLEGTIAARLATGRFLLVLDNCEHVVDDVAELVAQLQQWCPNTTVLATSRRRLAVPGERVVRLGPLATEPDAVRLFYDRARAIDGELDIDAGTAAALCRDLDGMPLAIEIAAARAASLGSDGLRAAAGDRLRLLRGGRGVHPRHASLEAVMSWSYDLLDAEERSVLRALSVFAGPFDLAAATAVTGVRRDSVVADLLGRLCDGSLVARAGRGRWRLLETVRAFAEGKLVAEQRGQVYERYVGWAAATAARLAGCGEQSGFAARPAAREGAAASASAARPNEDGEGSRSGPTAGPAARETAARSGFAAAAAEDGAQSGFAARPDEGDDTKRSGSATHLAANGEGSRSGPTAGPAARETAARSGFAAAAAEDGAQSGFAARPDEGDDTKRSGSATHLAANGEGSRSGPTARDSGVSSGFAAVAADLRGALAATAPRADPTAHDLAANLARAAFAAGFNREARGHFLAAAARGSGPGQAVADLRAAAATATAVYDGPAAVELLLAAALRARATGLANDAAAATASAVVVALRFPGEFRQRLPRWRAARLLAAAQRDADPADRRTAALIAAARAWSRGPEDGGVADEALALARKTGDPLLLLSALDVAMTGARRRGEVGDLLAERLELVAALPRHDPAAATEITDTFHVAVSCAMAAGDLTGAEALLATAARRDPLAEHPYVTAPRWIRLAVLLGRLDEGLVAAEELWDEWRRDGAPTRRWMATAPALAALAAGLREGRARVGVGAGSGSDEQRREQARTESTVDDAAGAHERRALAGSAANAADPNESPRHAPTGTDTDEPTASSETWRRRALEVADTDDAASSSELAGCVAFVDARLAVHTGRFDDARRLVERAFRSVEAGSAVPHPATGGRVWDGYARAAAAELAVVAGLPDAADRVAAAGRDADGNQWAAACLARARGRLGEPAALAESARRWERIGAAFERACTLMLVPERRAQGRAELDALGASSPAP